MVGEAHIEKRGCGRRPVMGQGMGGQRRYEEFWVFEVMKVLFTVFTMMRSNIMKGINREVRDEKSVFNF